MRQRVGLSFVVLACVLTVVASGGFSSAEADRRLSVAVVEDDRASVGYDSPATLDVDGGDEATLVTITNRFDTRLADVDAEIHVENETLDVFVSDTPASIGVGDAADVDVVVSCDHAVTAAVQATITVQGAAISVTVSGDSETRTLTVSCAPPEPESTTGNDTGTDTGG